MSVLPHVPDDDCRSAIAEKSSAVVEPTESDAPFFGPALPPQLLMKKQPAACEKIYGPTLPDNFGEEGKLQKNMIPLSNSDSNDKIVIGPELPEYLKDTSATASEVEDGEKPVNDDFDDEDGNCAFGPSTILMATGDVTSYYRFSSTQNKSQEDAGETSVKRETWMVELPEKKGASLGLFPRHFKSRIQTDKESDNSVWTDTPADKERKRKLGKKKDHKEILKMKRLQERDKEMEKLAKKAAKKLRKKESLLEMHLKNKKKKEKKEAKKREEAGVSVPERRPFDRNIDLQIRKFSQDQKRAILNKSQFLNDRFAAGESKFL